MHTHIDHKIECLFRIMIGSRIREFDCARYAWVVAVAAMPSYTKETRHVYYGVHFDRISVNSQPRQNWMRRAYTSMRFNGTLT